ncbi:hypothetical protein PABG_11210 [Paracoccidioides brasiliensis Pb03]|nr:hypothetical protein PABG_11210 [Paracoccidioides brasiliensis Pb03]
MPGILTQNTVNRFMHEGSKSPRIVIIHTHASGPWRHASAYWKGLARAEREIKHSGSIPESYYYRPKSEISKNLTWYRKSKSVGSRNGVDGDSDLISSNYN